MTSHAVLQGDVLERLRELPDASVDSCFTSPPYWALRSYLKKDNPLKTLEIGSESTPEEWLEKMWEVFGEVRRVLKDAGTCWVNLGDTYGGGAMGRSEKTGLSYRKYGFTETFSHPKRTVPVKSLLMLPEHFAWGMVERGWVLRNRICWHKRNAMPCSAKDRFGCKWEYVWFFAKKSRYWFDLDAVRNSYEGRPMGRWGGNVIKQRFEDKHTEKGLAGAMHNYQDCRPNPAGANPGDVWDITPQARSEAHFAAFPDKLAERVILCSTPAQVCCKCGRGRGRITKLHYEKTREIAPTVPDSTSLEYGAGKKAGGRNSYPGMKVTDAETLGWTDCGCDCEPRWQPGVILDPFAGRGTVACVAKRLGRSSISIELNPEYVKMIEANLSREQEILVDVLFEH